MIHKTGQPIAVAMVKRSNLRLEFKSICKRTPPLSTKKGRPRLVLCLPLTLVIISPVIQEVASGIYQPLFGNVGRHRYVMLPWFESSIDVLFQTQP